jgi:glycosyltransferase involved in cell wall biosynthesis
MFRVRREAERPLQAYEYFNLDISKRYLLFFGMLKRAKSLEVLLEALAKLPEDIHLIVAGRPRDMDYSYYSRLILKLGISGRVHSIIRYVTNEERHFLFTIPEAVVLPYRRIYQSGVLLLAMSYGLPVIASDLPANREVINNRNGTLFITGDSSDLADKIHLLLEDEARMKSISDSARDYVLQYHNWERIGDQFMQVFETMQ